MYEDLSVVLVSNRGPVSFVEDESGFETKRGAGGLAGALDPVARRLGENAIWIAAATSDVDRKALAAGAADGVATQLGYPLYLVDVDPHTYADYYDVVSNRMLWFANHCLWDELGIKEFGDEELAAWDDAYEPVNVRFARAIAEVADPDGLVLLQDYHLATAPRHLRSLSSGQTILHFTHSSFCGPEGLDRLPSPIPRRVIEGMLGADLVGFHVRPWAEAFVSCCERIGATVDEKSGSVEHEGRRSWIRTYPIPIDAADLRDRASGEAAQRWAERFEPGGKRKLLVRADRSEPSKNIVRGFDAFERLLERRPDLAESVTFVACLYPSRQSMPEYRTYAEDIQRTVERVNSRYPGSIDLYMKDDYDRTLGALQTYDALIVNPIMDGMNLVAKEGPALNRRDGVLILSTGAGSYSELGDNVIAINDPLDVDETSRRIETALELSSTERAGTAARLRERAVAARPGEWIEAQLDDLSAIRSGAGPETPSPFS